MKIHGHGNVSGTIISGGGAHFIILFDAVSMFIGLKELKFFFRGGVDVDVSLLHIIQNRQNVQAEMAYSKHVFVFQLLPMEVELI